jgi:hypothetical protein
MVPKKHKRKDKRSKQNRDFDVVQKEFNLQDKNVRKGPLIVRPALYI